MGCSGSKAEDLPLVVRCRERRELIRAAANHRYALAAAHVSYFHSLKDVGDALRKFVDEELITTSPTSSSSFSSPSLILPPNSKSKRDNAANTDKSSLHLHDNEDGDEESEGEDEDSHLNISDSSSEEEFHHHHHHHHNEEEERSSSIHPPHHYPSGGFYGQGPGFGGEGMVNDPFMQPYPNPNPYPPPSYGEQYVDPWYYANISNVYYMKKSAPASRTVIQEPPPDPGYGYSDSHWTSPAGYGYGGGNYGYSSMGNSAGYGSNYGYSSMGNSAGYGSNYGYSSMGNNAGVKVTPPKEAPPPPSPKASGWDFFNPFDEFGGGYPNFYTNERYGYGSESSSPDSTEVREREGIPDLEEETENEVYKEVLKGRRMKADARKSSGESTPRSRAAPVYRNNESSSRSAPLHTNEGSSRSVPLHNSEGSSRTVPMHKSEGSSRSVPSWNTGENEKPPTPHQYSGEWKPSMPPHYSRKQTMSHQYNEEPKVSMPPHYSERPTMPSQYNGEPKPSMPAHYSEEGTKSSSSPPESKRTTWADQSPDEETVGSISTTDEKSSSEILVSTSVDEGSMKKKGVTFEVGGTSKQDGDSSMLSSVTLLSPNGTRDLREVVAEIRDDFETATSHGKEVALMLEVGKLPYQPGFLKVLVSRILYLISPTPLRDPPSRPSAKLASRTMKLAKSYFEDVGNDVNAKACNLSSTLEKLYAWENKLYKEVKDEERLRVSYEKQCKRLKMLDEEGAESSKLDATQASIRRLLTKLDVSIKAIDAISSRIHKLRDEELQPQVAALIHGLIRMWKAMLKCHKKQFQAIMESKMRKLRAKTGLQTDSSSRATTELGKELRAWCDKFNDWIHFQKSYVESLNGWLLQCLQYEPEETPDGPVPYSPGRLGAPPIFVICNDWRQAMEAVSESRVANAMNTFATSLQQLWEKQDEEGRQRLKAEYMMKDYQRQLGTHHMEGKKLDHENDNKSGLSVIPSDSGISHLDDLKVDLDSMKQRLAEERRKHKDAMKLVHDAASSSLQGGLVPIFKALENFTAETLKAHEHVRLQHPQQSS